MDSTLRHDILGQLTVIKNALSFVLEGHTGEISIEAKKFLDEALKRTDQLVTTVMATKKEE